MDKYTIDIIIAVADETEPSPQWWEARYRWGDRRAGGMPVEVADPSVAELAPQVDPETGDLFARVTLPFPPGTTLGRATELSHMLSSVLTAEGYTLRCNGKRLEAIAGEPYGEPTGEFGPETYSQARVVAGACMNCVVASERRIGCCTEGCAFSLADIGKALLDGEEQFVADCLAVPGEMDGVKFHPYLVGGRCRFHGPERGCTLPQARMPLQCRTYLCMPERLLPPALLAQYEAYVDGLEEIEFFVEEHMRTDGGVDFGSPLSAVKQAACRAFAAWEASREPVESTESD